ncbi:exodeoxyribonuclease V subunit beta [Rhodanobacter ginsengisoli]|uniref:RecBCD enzyme subunit RecB n=1 Tax=Rhodanobacter ginsengisoli TaxID=418646 RepID=A0ABW0QN64_9GAMM
MIATEPLQPLTLPLQGIRLIEASAGTGKTWTIAALYLRLVLGRYEHAKPLLPPQILVVTFTKAATAELRERIRRRLGEAAGAFRANAATDDYLRALIANYPDEAARALAARQLELAAQWMDEAAVHTIHGWSQRMLSQHAFDSGYPFVQNVSGDESELLGEAVRDYWRQHFFALDRGDAMQISQLWSGPQALQKDVAPLLRRTLEQLRVEGRPLPPVDDIADLLARRLVPVHEAEARARQSWSTHAAELAAMLVNALKTKSLSGSSYKQDKLDSDLAELATWADGGARPDRAVIERASQGKLARATNKNGTTPTHASFVLMDHLLEALDATPPLRPLLLAQAVPWIAARLDATKQRLAQMGYDDMLKRLDQALHGGTGERLAQTIAGQYPVALIDEYQDTDPQQWRIFQRIYADRADTGLLLIGDPKQAIYGFRGADIHTYLHARRQAGTPTWTLDTNYRSTRSLVRAVNHVFEHAEQHAQGAFAFGKGDNALPFHPVKASGRGEQLLLLGEPIPALQLALAHDRAPMSKAAYQAQLAGHAAAWLVALLNAAEQGECGFADDAGGWRPLAPGDVAILVRSGTEAACMRQALQARGLASVYLSDRDSVYASPEAGDLLLWLHACATPGSDRAMRAALASTTLSQAYHELDRLNRDENHWEQMGERFRQLHDSWLRQGVLAMLHELLHLFDLPAQLLAMPQGERTLTNLLHLAELLQQAAAALDGEHALLRHLAHQIAEAHDGRVDTAEEKIVRLESEAALIQVITIHKSKGLEYPLVLLPFACAMRETKLADGFVLHDGDGEATLDLQPSEAARERADEERLQEDLRLFYVAMTRAQHACWLGVADLRDGQKKVSGLHKSAFGYVLNGSQAFGEGKLAGQLKALGDGHPDVQFVQLADEVGHDRHRASRDTPPAQPARSYHGAPIEPWWIASYSALRVASDDASHYSAPETAQQDVMTEALAERVDAPVVTAPVVAAGIHAFPRGAEPGTFLHDLLEGASHEGFAAAAQMPDALRQQIEQRCRRRGWQPFSDTLIAWLPAFLRTPLRLPDGSRVALADADRCRAEMEFWFEATGVDTQALDRLVTAQTLGARPRPPLLADRLNGMLKGFIDLVVEHDGRFYIVDYKSNWLGPDDRAYTVEAMDASVRHSRYDLQYAIYTLALHRQLRARLPGYDYAQHVGGVLYLYLRGVGGSGQGVHRERLPYALIDAMDRLFAEGAPA